MKWFLNIFFTSEIDKKRKKVAELQKKAFDEQRNGNLSLSGKYQMEAQKIEDEILEMQNKSGVDNEL